MWYYNKVMAGRVRHASGRCSRARDLDFALIVLRVIIVTINRLYDDSRHSETPENAALMMLSRIGMKAMEATTFVLDTASRLSSPTGRVV